MIVCTNVQFLQAQIWIIRLVQYASRVTFFARSTPYSCLDSSRCHLMESFWWEPWGSSVGSCPNPPETQQPDTIDIDMISPLSCFCQMKFEEKSVDLQMFWASQHKSPLNVIWLVGRPVRNLAGSGDVAWKGEGGTDSSSVLGWGSWLTLLQFCVAYVVGNLGFQFCWICENAPFVGEALVFLIMWWHYALNHVHNTHRLWSKMGSRDIGPSHFVMSTAAQWHRPLARAPRMEVSSNGHDISAEEQLHQEKGRWALSQSPFPHLEFHEAWQREWLSSLYQVLPVLGSCTNTIPNIQKISFHVSKLTSVHCLQ